MFAYYINSWVKVTPEARSGGFVSFWNPGRLNILLSQRGRHWIRIKGKIITNGLTIFIFNIYAPHAFVEKEALWSTLTEKIKEFPDDLICIIGDFNCVRESNKRLNCNYRKLDSLALITSLRIINFWTLSL